MMVLALREKVPRSSITRHADDYFLHERTCSRSDGVSLMVSVQECEALQGAGRPDGRQIRPEHHVCFHSPHHTHQTAYSRERASLTLITTAEGGGERGRER